MLEQVLAGEERVPINEDTEDHHLVASGDGRRFDPAQPSVVPLQDQQLRLGEIALRLHEREPAIVVTPQRAWQQPTVEELQRHRTAAKLIAHPAVGLDNRLLPPGHRDGKRFAAMTAAEEALGLYAEPSLIGFRLAWARLLAEKRVTYRGHKVVVTVPGGTERPGTGAPGLPEGPADDSAGSEPGVSPTSLAPKRHRTAIGRAQLSRPVQCAMEHGLLVRGKTVFDHAEPEILHFKHRYVSPDHPKVEAWRRFSRQMERAGVDPTQFRGLGGAGLADLPGRSRLPPLR